jgi:hypothetical protein
MAANKRFIAPGGEYSEYEFCEKHNMTYGRGFCCPYCSKPSRSIFDEWTPSQEQVESEEVLEEWGDDQFAKLAMDGQYTLKMLVCPIHGERYIQGFSKCPWCENNVEQFKSERK